MAYNVLADTPEKALEALFTVAATESFDLGEIVLGNWPQIEVYIPDPDKDSSITPPYMEAFLLIQKQLFQLAALAKTGVADTKMLSDSEIRNLTISVEVSGGSSDLKTKLSEQLIHAIPSMVRKMNGKQVTIVLLATALLLTSGWAFSSWLQSEKDKRIEELKSQEHIAALTALSFANKAQAEQFSKVLQLLEAQGTLGKKAVDATSAAYDAMLRAASRTSASTINGQALTKEQADTLRVSPRRKAQVRIVKQEMRVVDINTEDPLDIQFVLLDEATGDQHRLRSKDTLFSAEDRTKLFAALESRDQIWVELAVSEIQGEIKSVEFLRVTDAPRMTQGQGH